MRISAEFERAFQNRGAGTRTEAAIKERARPIGDDFCGIEIVFGTEAVAFRAGAIRRIETEGTGLKLRNGKAAIGASQFFRKGVFAAADNSNSDEALRQFQGRGDGLFEARGNALLDEQAIDDHFDGVILALVENRRLVERQEFAINAHAHEAVLREFFEFLAISAFAATHDGREDHDAIVGLAQLAVEDRLDDLFAGLASDGLAAIRAMRHANRGVDDAKVIVDFGDGADGRTRGPRGGFLFDGDGGRQAFDDVHFGALHLVQELARIGGKRFDVSSLSFGVDGVEGQGRLAGTRQSGNDGQRVPRDFQADVFEVVLPRAAHNQFAESHKEKRSLHRSPGTQ